MWKIVMYTQILATMVFLQLKFASFIDVDEITFTEHYDDYTGLDTKLKTLNLMDYYNKYLLYMYI